VTPKQIDALRRELLIGSRAARKLSNALAIAWAQLTENRFSDPMGGDEKGVGPDGQQKQDGGVEPPLPFLEDPFL